MVRVAVPVYLAAIVVANLTVATFGPSVSILNAFVLIGLDLTVRDALHERWKHRHLAQKMALLVVAGSAISWILNREAAQIAIASAVAFGGAAVADTVVYHLARRSSRFARMTTSNSISAAVDSLLFPTIAFGGFLPLVTLGQYVAKVAGGAIWAWLWTRSPRCDFCGRGGTVLSLTDVETLERSSVHDSCVKAFGV